MMTEVIPRPKQGEIGLGGEVDRLAFGKEEKNFFPLKQEGRGKWEQGWIATEALGD